MSNTFSWDVRFSGLREATALAGILGRLDDIFGVLTRSQQQHATVANQSTASVNNYAKASTQAGRATQTWGRRVIHLAGNFNTLNKAFDFTLKRARQLYTGMTALFNFVFSKSSKFEEGAAALRAYGDAQGEVAQKASDLARVSRFTSEQAVSAAIELKKAGQSNVDAMSSMGPVLTASAANSISLGKAAKIAANGMAQFSRYGTTAKETLEVMTGGAMSATTDMSELASAMKNAAPISSLLGQNITKVTTALAIMAKNGITAGRAGTAWKIAMQRLSAPTPAATKNLQALGISLKDIDLSNPAHMLEIFRQAIAKIPKESEQIKMLKPVFGRSIGAILPMIQAGKAGFDAMTESVTKNRQAMSNLETEKAKTMQHAYLMMGSAVEGLAIQLKAFLGVPITGFFQTAADAINKVKDRLNEFSEGFGEAGMSVNDWLTAVQNGDFSGLFAGLKEEFSKEIGTIQQLFSGLKTLVKSWFADLWTHAMDDGIVTEIAAFGNKIIDAIFSPQNVGKATKFGMELGTSLVKGFASTTKGKLAIGALGVMGGAKVAGTAMSAYGAAKTMGGTAMFAGGIGKATAALGKFSSGLLGLIAKIPVVSKVISGVVGISGAGAGLMAAGAVAYGGIKAAEKYVTRQGEAHDLRGATALSQGIQDLSAKRKAAVDAGDTERVARIDKQLDTMQTELNGMGGTGMMEESRKRAEAEVAAANQISPEEALRRKNEAMLLQGTIEDFGAAVTPEQKKIENTPEAPQGPKSLAEMSDEELASRKEILSVQQQIAQAEHDQKAAMDEINTVTEQAQLDFSKYAEALETWLVRPFSKFQEAVNSAKEKFGGLIDGLKSKKIDLSEKFGLTSSEDAAKQRKDVLEKANKRDEKLLEMTEDPAKKAEIQERMADRLAKAAESAQGPEQQRLAKQAAGLLEDAEDSTGLAQDDELKRVEIRKKFAEKNVGVLEGMLRNTESAGARATILEKLQESYTDLGMREKANANIGELEESKLAAAVEDAEMRRESLEIQKTQLEILQRQLEQLESMNNDNDTNIPEDPNFRV